MYFVIITINCYIYIYIYKYKYMLLSRIIVSDILSDPLVIGHVHSNAISTPYGAYSPEQELTIAHRDSITAQPGTHFTPG